MTRDTLETRRGALLASLLIPLCTACGAPPVDEASSALVLTKPECAPGETLCLDAPAAGFQVMSSSTTIAPGEDVEFCEVVQLPGTPDDTFYVRGFETQMTPGSHHLIVSAVEPGTATDEAATVGDRRACRGTDVYGGEVVPVTGAQLPYASEIFPAGVGRIYRGGQKLVIDMHYFNTTPEVIEGRTAVNFHTTEAANIDKISHGFGFYNMGIEIPPGTERAFKGACQFDQPVMVHKLTRHTHRWGTDFRVWFDGGPRDGELVFHSTHYETVEHPMEPAVRLESGQGFAFECAFANTEDYTLEFGLTASDEMCILFGNWFAVDDQPVNPEQGCFLF